MLGYVVIDVRFAYALRTMIRGSTESRREAPKMMIRSPKFTAPVRLGNREGRILVIGTDCLAECPVARLNLRLRIRSRILILGAHIHSTWSTPWR